ncbi:hypothetical protein Fcan01_17295 [Folsomia candida]|uniref:Uncharacterized protein n=1 Tax=Folsomia candida TaxID=158441 RepID=A0A226DT15_FOLCA|nr:hypothetical protein Fcan01_17295 [Folsomia candida]
MILMNSQITNLPQYLNIFQTCVLHIINYQNIHIPPVEFPILLSRHEFIRVQYPAMNTLAFHFLQLNGSLPVTYDKPLNRSQFDREAYWPQPDITEEDFTLVGDKYAISSGDSIEITQFLAFCRYCVRFSRTFFKITMANSIPTLGEIQHFTQILNNRHEFSVPIYISIENNKPNHLHQSDSRAVGKTQLFQLSENGITGTDLLLDLVTSKLNRSVAMYNYQIQRHWDCNDIHLESRAFYERSPKPKAIFFDRVETMRGENLYFTVDEEVHFHIVWEALKQEEFFTFLSRIRRIYLEFHFGCQHFRGMFVTPDNLLGRLRPPGFQLQIEQGTDLLVKQNLRKYWKTIPLTFTLFLTTIVLTNASKGENILNIIAPPADKPFTNFPTQGAEFHMVKDRRFGPTQTYASEISPDQYNEIVGNISYERKNLERYHKLEDILKKTYGDECPKIAVLSWINNLHLMQEKLNIFYELKMGISQNKVRFSLGRQFLMTQLQGWKLSHIVHNTVHRRVQDLIQFGFLDKILWYQNQSEWLSRRRKMASLFPRGQTDTTEGFCRFIRNLAFEYDSKYGKFFLIKSKTPVIKAKVAYVLSLIYVCVLLYRIANFPMLRMLQGFPILFCYVLLLSIGPNVGLDIAPVQIINSILTFEKDLLQDGESMKTSLEARVMFFFLCLAQFSCILMPFAVIALLSVDPCMPPFLLSMFHCTEISWTSPGAEIFVLIFEAWMALQLFTAGTPWVFYILFAGIVAILDYFKLLKKNLHFTYDVSYIILNFSRIASSKAIVDQHSCLKLYRSIQILEKYMNGFLMARVAPMMVMSIPAIQIACGLLVYTFASWVSSTSTKVLQTHAGVTVQFGGKRSVLAREIRACGALKIKFGSNFIDNGTPLVIQNFCLNQTVNLLLISSGRRRTN